MTTGPEAARPAVRPETARRRLPLAGIAVGLVVLAVAVPLILAIRGGPTPSVRDTSAPTATPTPAAPREPARTAVASVERQTAALRLQAFRADPLDPFAPVDVATEGFAEQIRLEPPYMAVDSTVFDARGIRVRLDGVWPVGRAEVCNGAGGARLACGLAGRAALQNFIAGRTVTCLRRFASWPGTVVVADCRVDGEDLAERMIRMGQAFPAPERGDWARAALDEARTARRGVWAGDHVLPTRDRAGEDIAATPYDPAVYGQTE
jgi:endonuclease YncB( thermonuclease family)